jgi:small subunit ribosomal protein S20
MLSYKTLMPNTRSAKKAVRSSAKKRQQNLLWKKRTKLSIKAFESGIADKSPSEVVAKEFVALQKVLDKASKEKVLHKNRANRLKSKYARKLAAIAEKAATKKPAESAKHK